MNAVILAGGEGTRLREIIKDVPKPMASIASRPFLEYLILQVCRWGIKDIVLSVGYKRETIKSYFNIGDKWGIKILYSDEVEPLGTGGAIKKAAQLISGEDFIAMNGDSFLNVDFNQLVAFHKYKQSIITIGSVHISDTSRYGSIKINDKGEVIGFLEKGISGSGFINGGVYILNRKAMNYIPDGKISFESAVLPRLVTHGLHAMETKGFFLDIGVPKDYLKLYKEPQKLLNVMDFSVLQK